jgi:cytochrome c553
MPERFTASAIAANERVKGLACFALCALTLMIVAGSAGAQTKPRSTGKAASAAAPANPYPERFAAVCAACHGANGRSDMPGTPVLAGQHSFYAITQLFLFREGRRSNEAMSAVAKTMSDADLRGFSEFIGTLPPVPAPAPATPPDAARMKKGRELAQLHKCLFCHGPDLSGGQQVPRIGGQREDYLQMSLQESKSGKRPGYTMAMTEAVSQVTPEELDTLAYYAAHFPSATASGK